VVYTRTGKVLLLQRADHPEFWQSITGSMEWGDEQPAETAARELREETGITAAPAAFTDWKLQNRYVIFPQWRYKYAPGVTENTEHFFSLELPDEPAVTLSPDEHSEYAWVPFAEAVERVQAALDELVARGWVEKIVLVGGTVLYAADRAHHRSSLQ